MGNEPSRRRWPTALAEDDAVVTGHDALDQYGASTRLA
jgi:hypothetical protein